MKVKALENYFDLVLRKQIAVGELLEVTNERGTELADKKLVEIIKEQLKKSQRLKKENNGQHQNYLLKSIRSKTL